MPSSATRTDIFTALTGEHDEQRALIRQILDTSGDTQERRELFSRLDEHVRSHSAAEEQSLLATLLRRPDFTSLTRHGVAEHHEVHCILKDLAEMDTASNDWLARFRTFQDKYEHHLEEEEDDMFPKARQALSDEERQVLGAYFEKRKKKEEEKL